MTQSLFLARVDDAQDTITRTRTAFLISNLVTLAAFTANFNLYFSWMRHLPHRADIQAVDGLAALIRETLLRDLMIISVPVVGLKVAATDIGVVSAFAMSIVAVWLYYSFRHEQHSVARLILEVARKESGSALKLTLQTGEDSLETARFVLFALSTRFVFVTGSAETTVAQPHSPPWVAQAAQRVLLWGPVWVLVLSGMADVVSAVFPSTVGGGGRSLWSNLNSWMRGELVARVAITLGVALFVVRPLIARAQLYVTETQAYYRALGAAVMQALGEA